MIVVEVMTMADTMIGEYDVVHYPYCHGWEIRDQVVGILASGPMAVHSALLFRQWTPHLTLFLHTAPPPSDDEREQLAARGISVVDGEVECLDVSDDHLTGIRLRTGTVIPCQALVVMPHLHARAGLLNALGIEVVPHPLGLGTYVESDAGGLTGVPGVLVAGAIANPMLQVMGAAASGSMAAAAINGDLVVADVAHAVSVYRNSASPESNNRSVHPEPHHDRHGDGSPDVVMDEAFWDERYSSSDALWSGNPNPQLLSETSDLSPGRALDAGCGEGADAIWLAERGWQVTAVDLSAVALERGAARAMQAGAEVARRIEWMHADLTGWVPAAGAYDLVSAHFMHLPNDQRETLYRRLAESVVPGGTLLIVGHHPSDMQTTMPRLRVLDMFFTGDDLAAQLDPNEWAIVTNSALGRTATDPEGRTVTIHDAVLRARRHM